MWQRLRALLVRIIPFGLLSRHKPRHFREMAGILWENRGRWGYAWRILRHGVCDGCSLGTTGMRDEVLAGPHLCLTRLKLLRLNTMRAMPETTYGRADLDTLSNEELHHLGRIPFPLLKRAGEKRFSRVSWATAVELVAEKLRTSDPDRMGFFLTSRGLTNETYYVMQKLARIAGTPHVDTCARLCHAASGVGLKQTIGWGAPTISLTDLIGSELIFIIGSNLPNNQPVATKYLRAARQAGSKVIVINPFKEPSLERYWIPSVPLSALFGSRLMDEYYPVRPGGDIAFMNGMLKALDEQDGFDSTFIERHTQGVDELKAQLRRTPWSELVESAGVSEAELRSLATAYGKAKSAVFIYSMGLTQYEFGVDNVKTVVNLALSRGMIGRPLCGILPIRGHSGVQGSAECGADADKLPGALAIDERNCSQLEAAYGHPIPRRAGLRAAHLLDRARETGLDLLYLVGGNHLETMPGRRLAAEGLANVGLRVHQDIVLNSSALLDAKEAVLLLPAQTRYEQRTGGTSTSTERRIRFTPEIEGPRIGEAKAEWEIPTLIGRAVKPERPDLFAFDDSADIRDEMAQVMPLYRGIETLSQEGDSIQWGGPSLGAQGFVNMPDERALFSCVAVPRVDVPLGRFLLTMRRGKQFNSMTYGKRDPLSANAQRQDILIDDRDMHELGVKPGDRVIVRSPHGEMQAQLKEGPCRTRHVQGYWPECNVLLTPRYDPESGEPDYNAVVELVVDAQS